MRPWQIIFDGSPSKQLQFGMESLSAAIREYTNYWPHIGEEDARFSGIRLRKAAPQDGVPAGGYRIRVHEPRDDRQLAEILGADETAIMHGCMDFCEGYLASARLSRRPHNPYYLNRLFTEAPLPPADYVSFPRIQRRGLWTWGMAIYDWRGYLENMARLKLNEVIIWNDFAPVNGREIVEYAHGLGIRVIWGYAWGWDTTMRLDVSDKASFAIIDKYEREYAPLGGDGIYFQSFTETSQETLDGKLIAQAVVEFVNRTAGRLLERHPGLRLQFGLHAESVRNRLEHIARVDPGVEIIWENCGGFPYASSPSDIGDQEETRAFTERLLSLRPGAGTGAVFKSMIQLDWSRFQHQTGPALLGCGGKTLTGSRLSEVREIWRWIAAEWLDHGEMCLNAARQYAANANTSVYNLVEDGLFEREIPLPAALYAGILWDPDRSWKEILSETLLRGDLSV